MLARVDLAIGLDTFRPITADSRRSPRDPHRALLGAAATVAACAAAERVVAVGTTAVRALESAAATGELSGRTDLYIHGDYPFRVVDVLITNFHLPRSSLLLLVESFCGPVWRDLYADALATGYRFLSFGDAMVVGAGGPKGRAARHDGTGSVKPLSVEVAATDGAARTGRVHDPTRAPTGRRPSCRWGPGERSRRSTAPTSRRSGPRWSWPTPTT